MIYLILGYPNCLKASYTTIATEFDKFKDLAFSTFIIGILIPVSKLACINDSGSPYVSFPNTINELSTNLTSEWDWFTLVVE